MTTTYEPPLADEILTPRAKLVCLADVEPERVTWLWPGRIPAGKLSIIEGDPGLGKSTLTLDLAARITRGGMMPDGARCNPGSVLILTAEDGLGDTVRPRLEAANADLRRIFSVPEDPEEGAMSLPNDLAKLEGAVTDSAASLLIVDPLVAFLGGAVDSWRDQDVRRALSPLASLAERTGAAVLCIRHLTKTTGRAAIYRGGGSIGIIGAARSAFVVLRDPEDEARRVLAPVKANLGPMPSTLQFQLTGAGDVAVVSWLGEDQRTADQLFQAGDDEQAEERGAVDEAAELVREWLAGEPVAKAELVRLARGAGVSERTLKRALRRVGATFTRTGFGATTHTVWSIR